MTSTIENTALADHPLAALEREDLDLVVELVLRSGSLKDLAASYGVSYPTIRLRLNRLIERLQAAVEGQKPDPLSELLARLVERGEMSMSGARAVRDLVRQREKASGSEA
ncbi:MAG: DUF2089 family protein [Planctomycetota bacterium]|nr:MAG: DUF2089 family protein [Planctomycetota bacterium]